MLCHCSWIIIVHLYTAVRLSLYALVLPEPQRYWGPDGKVREIAVAVSGSSSSSLKLICCFPTSNRPCTLPIHLQYVSQCDFRHHKFFNIIVKTTLRCQLCSFLCVKMPHTYTQKRAEQFYCKCGGISLTSFICVRDFLCVWNQYDKAVAFLYQI